MPRKLERGDSGRVWIGLVERSCVDDSGKCKSRPLWGLYRVPSDRMGCGDFFSSVKETIRHRICPKAARNMAHPGNVPVRGGKCRISDIVRSRMRIHFSRQIVNKREIDFECVAAGNVLRHGGRAHLLPRQVPTISRIRLILPLPHFPQVVSSLVSPHVAP